MVSVQPATQDVFALFVEGFECYNRHDFDAMEEMYRPDAVFDPSRVTDGIECSDDPVLRFRPRAYSESIRRRADFA